MRITVHPASCLSTSLSTRPEENQCRVLDIEDTPFGRGAQGEIYPAVRIDGTRVSHLLVKVFYQGFPASLPEVVTAVRENNKKYNIDQCRALQALPLFLFTGRLQGKTCHGYVMRRVSGKPFHKILEDELTDYINLPLEDRLTFCLHFVQGMHILYSLRLVHADINGQNLLVDTTNCTLTIIDLDGGALSSRGTAPVVIGKPEPGWLAPEIMAKLAHTTTRQQIEVGIQVDLWSIACGVHHLLFGLAPFLWQNNQRWSAI